jgi:hypothetical protein
MKAKRQNRATSVSATMLDGTGGHVKGNWLEAEHELRAAAKSHSLIAKVRGGSVQA